ncbi:Mariner Mos1 transposase [Caligus rogercresseyi]|uniref:Mariner Mos1 transposase n=1 Tax=Caligus rogercresseyi TaxID=217165 RepID=A0A7T8GPV7_CALRO|nr:Mariner Mos1 transposase [Caligus rogercresseyi]
MSRIHKFAEDLAKARKTSKEIKTKVDTAFEVNSISQSQIYRILALVKAGKDSSDKRSTNGRRKVRTDDFIEALRVYVEDNRRFETSTNTIFHVLHDDLGLSIKSARWIPKMLTEDHKMKRVRCAKAFLKLNFELGLGFLDKIVTMDETSSQRGSSQWLPKGSNPPLKFKRQESKKKQMVLSFFDNCGVIFQHNLPMKTSDVIKMFLKKFKEKRPEMAKRDWYFHFDNAPCHTANSTKEFLAKKGIKVIDHPPYSPDLAPIDFFYFPVIKKMLEGVEIVNKSVQKEWIRVGRAIPEDRFREAFRKWVERWEKCIRIGGSHV